MAQNTDPTTDRDLRARDVVYTERPVATTDRPIVTTDSPVVETTRDADYREYRTTEPVIVDHPSRWPSFLAGFITAIILAAIAFGTFLVVSDSDDDGNIDVNVPAVDVSSP